MFFSGAKACSIASCQSERYGKHQKRRPRTWGKKSNAHHHNSNRRIIWHVDRSVALYQSKTPEDTFPKYLAPEHYRRRFCLTLTQTPQFLMKSFYQVTIYAIKTNRNFKMYFYCPFLNLFHSFFCSFRRKLFICSKEA